MTPAAKTKDPMVQRILAIDDEPHMLRLLERLIEERTSYQITATSNSLEVPKLLRHNTFDLILTDLRMPGLDGMDILRMVNDQNRFEEVIIITAFGSLENAHEALTLGVVDYITKPFKRKQIILAIEKAMHRQQSRRDAEWTEGIFDIEPFENACGAFEREYVRRLTQRCNGDRELMVDRSGLPVDRIESLAVEADEGTD
jgi:YesN/AraC family two-component response regulator